MEIKCTFLATKKKKTLYLSIWNLNNEIKLTLAKISNLGIFNYFSLSPFHFELERFKI